MTVFDNSGQRVGSRLRTIAVERRDAAHTNAHTAVPVDAAEGEGVNHSDAEQVLPGRVPEYRPEPSWGQATQWGAWTIAPIARTDDDGTVTPAGGLSIALQALPSVVCSRVASALREGAVTVRVDGLAVGNVGAVAAACGTDGGHTVAMEVMDGAKVGPGKPSA